MKSSKFTLISFFIGIAVLSSCRPPAYTGPVLAWDPTLTASRITAIVLTETPTGTADIRELEFVPREWPKPVFVRVADSAGNLYRLPKDIIPTWHLYSTGLVEAVTINGYIEETREPFRRTRDGSAVGQVAYISVRTYPDMVVTAEVLVEIDGVLFQRSFSIDVLNR